MEISLSSFVSDLDKGEVFKAGNTGSNGNSDFSFSDPAFTSQQLKEKWSGNYIDFGNFNKTSNETVSNWRSDLSLPGINTQSSTEMKDGKVAYENENYTINVSDKGEININNKETGEHYRIWGDPHVDVDGKRAFDFKGDTTFVLDDGTKVSIETTPWKGNNGQTISSTVSIIDGQSNYGVRITGVDDNQLGDLNFEEVPNFGHFLDALVDDGNYVHENPMGKGFIAVGPDGWAEVDQSVMDFQENTMSRLGLGTPTDAKAQSDEASNNPLSTLFSNDSVTASLNDLAAYLNSFNENSSTNKALQSLLTQTLESLLSLANQQSRPFAHMSGLDQIQSRGAYEIDGADQPFSFSLNFKRA